MLRRSITHHPSAHNQQTGWSLFSRRCMSLFSPPSLLHHLLLSLDNTVIPNSNRDGFDMLIKHAPVVRQIKSTIYNTLDSFSVSFATPRAHPLLPGSVAHHAIYYAMSTRRLTDMYHDRYSSCSLERHLASASCWFAERNTLKREPFSVIILFCFSVGRPAGDHKKPYLVQVVCIQL